MESFIKSVLEDDHGISEKSWDLLLDYLYNNQLLGVELEDYLRTVNATDGRYYKKN